MSDKIDSVNKNMDTSLNQNTEYLQELQAMFSEIKECYVDGPYGIQCAAAITDKYIRRLSFMKDLIYPWRNYDWDYTEYVKKNYNTQLLKVSGDGTMTAIVNDVDAILKLIEGLLYDANPDNASSASNPASSKNDLVNCYRQAGGVSCRILNAARITNLTQKMPYNDDFFKKHLDGQYSSSYFVKVGMCPTKITDQATCEGKNFTWIPNPLYELPSMLRGPDTKAGSCYKGKYTFMDNKPGYPIGNIKDLNGLIPSLANDMVDLSPDKIMAAALGIGVQGMDSQKCTEGFSINTWSICPFNKNNKNNNNYLIFFLILIILSILVMLKVYLIK